MCQRGGRAIIDPLKTHSRQSTMMESLMNELQLSTSKSQEFGTVRDTLRRADK